MSTLPSTQPIPINISKSEMSGKCDEKCMYSFKYQTSLNCNASNYGTYLSLTYDNTSNPPVIFNNNPYTVNNIEIYSPSIHKFNNNITDVEIIINHTSNNTGMPLMVCIPVNTSGISTEGSQILDDVINQTTSYPLKSGDNSIALHLNKYNLNSIVPSQPFYYYVSSSNSNVIVFSITSALFISQNSLKNLQTIISASTNIIAGGINNALFYNGSGPSSSSLNTDDGIYIDCQPTGNSEETADVVFSKNSVYDLGSYFNTEYILYFLGPILMVALIVTIYKIFIIIISTFSK